MSGSCNCIHFKYSFVQERDHHGLHFITRVVLSQCCIILVVSNICMVAYYNIRFILSKFFHSKLLDSERGVQNVFILLFDNHSDAVLNVSLFSSLYASEAVVLATHFSSSRRYPLPAVEAGSILHVLACIVHMHARVHIF